MAYCSTEFCFNEAEPGSDLCARCGGGIAPPVPSGKWENRVLGCSEAHVEVIPHGPMCCCGDCLGLQVREVE